MKEAAQRGRSPTRAPARVEKKPISTRKEAPAKKVTPSPPADEYEEYAYEEGSEEEESCSDEADIKIPAKKPDELRSYRLVGSAEEFGSERVYLLRSERLLDERKDW